MLTDLLHTLALTGLLALGFCLLGLLSDHLLPVLARFFARRPPTDLLSASREPHWRSFAAYLHAQRHADLGQRFGAGHD